MERAIAAVAHTHTRAEEHKHQLNTCIYILCMNEIVNKFHRKLCCFHNATYKATARSEFGVRSPSPLRILAHNRPCWMLFLCIFLYKFKNLFYDFTLFGSQSTDWYFDRCASIRFQYSSEKKPHTNAIKFHFYILLRLTSQFDLSIFFATFLPFMQTNV